MSASLPGDNRVGLSTGPAANRSAGNLVTFDLLSGPKGSPLDVRKMTMTTPTPTYANDDANQTRSTGALSTGIGFGSGASLSGAVIGPTAPASIKAAGFNDDYTPGVTKPDGTAATTSILM